MNGKFVPALTAACLAGLWMLVTTSLAGAAPQIQDTEPPVRLEPGSLCMDCHQSVGDKAVVHRPVRWFNCDLCHLQSDPELHSFTDPESMGAVCTECHVMPMRLSAHKPMVDGDCLSCHVPHHSDKRYLLKLPTEKELCGQCHQDQVGTGKKFIHGPVTLGACSLCHLSHSSVEPKLLRKSGTDACLECHADMHDILKESQSVHTPVQQNCALCHDPHASDNRYHLKTELKTLCMDCHQPMLEEMQAKPVFHAALNTEEGCLHCHDVHSSPFPSTLKRPVRELCMSCHTDPIEREDGSALPGMGDIMEHSTFLHGPLKEGNCEACHDPHGSVTFSLLRDPYPKTFYAPYTSNTYGLCYRCHDAGAFEDVMTGTLTQFRNGERNLHFLHVNDDKKGRTCRACHETHGSNFPKHLRESVPFGTWELPINFSKTPSGGSCSPGCHAPKTYDRLNAVADFSLRPPSVPEQQGSNQ